MRDDRSNADLPSDELLIAYLDGELDPEGRRRIEDALAQNEDVRRRLQTMERTWELLDELDATPVGSRFTQSTLEMVAVAARHEVEESLAEAPRRRRRRLQTLIVCSLVAFLMGFAAVAWLRPDPNRRLLEDLSVLENLDEYRQIQDIEFLELLHGPKLFAVDAAEMVVAPQPSVPKTLAERRQRVEQADLAEKQRLSQLAERFSRLDSEERKRLRNLDREITPSDCAAELRATMHAYCRWAQSLSSFARAELAQLPAVDRLKSVQEQFQEEKIHLERRQVEEKDASLLGRWVQARAAAYELKFLETLSETQRKRLDGMSVQQRRRVLFFEMWQPGQPPPGMTNDDLAHLPDGLSDEFRKRLESLPPPEQWRRIVTLAWRGARQKFADRIQGPSSEAHAERLAKFFENDLSDQQREQLMELPGSEMQEALQRLFWQRGRKPEDGPRRGPPPGHLRDGPGLGPHDPPPPDERPPGE